MKGSYNKNKSNIIVSLENEIWKSIEGFQNYEVSNFGRVKSLVNNIILTPILSGKYKNYHRIKLPFKNKCGSKHHFVHRLVAKAFLLNPNNLPQINHKDENTKNNNVDNLEWCDNKYNINYYYRLKKLRKG